jgi:hypothetical protein
MIAIGKQMPKLTAYPSLPLRSVGLPGDRRLDEQAKKAIDKLTSFLPLGTN